MTQSDRDQHYCFLDDNTHHIFYSHDLEGNHTSVNRAGEPISGFTLERTNPDDRIKIYLQKRKAGERAANLTQQLLALSRPPTLEPAANLNDEARFGEDAGV